MSKILKIFIAIVLLASIQTSVIAATIGTVNADTVRVREEATTKSDIVGLVSIGAKVTIIGQEDDWYKVNAKADNGKNIEGYIRKDLLTVKEEVVVDTTDEKNDDNNEPEPPVDNNSGEEPDKVEEPSNNEETPNEPTVEQPVENSDRKISTIKVNNVSVGEKVQLTEETKIKILPSANSSNIAVLEVNTEVAVIEVINSWCRIEAGENVGWVRIDQ